MQLVVGRIKRPHGIRGDVLVEVRTDTPGGRFAAGAELSTDPATRGPLSVVSSRPHAGLLIVAFAGVADREAAEALRGTWLVLDSDELGPTGDPDEFHDHELIGLTALTVGDERLGVVADVLHHGQDLLVIKREDAGELLVPFVAAIVPVVDVAAGRLVIDPPPGLLDPLMRIDIITIFPGYFTPLGMSLIGKAAERGDIEFAVHDLRAWARDIHHTVDDTPYGGGPGMVMKPEPWGDALDAVLPPDGGASARLVVPAPSGTMFTQDAAIGYAGEAHLVFACGRYEGIDARVIEDARARVPVDEVSIGDYVLAGGEPAVLVMIEAVCRLLPGVLGNAESAADDSFGGGSGSGGMAGLLEGPVYTRPRVWRGREVPPVLISGDHAKIARWRRDAALRRTVANRPDLMARQPLDSRDRQVLSEAGFPVRGQDMAH